MFKSFLKLVFSLVLFFQTNAVWSQPGNALNFDGIDDNIVTTLNVDESIVPVTTWEAWVYPTTNDVQWRMIMSIEDGGWDRFVAMNGGNFYVGIGLTSGGWLPVSMDLNKWQHIAVVFNEAAGIVYFYKNGVQYSHALTSHSAAVNFGIGCSQQAGPTQFYQGSIDEVRIWNVEKSQAQILASMGTELVGNESNLLAYYNFNQGDAGSNNAGLSYLTDQTGNGYTGTVSNFSLYGSASNWVESYAMVVPTSSPATSITATGFTANWTAPATGTVENYVLDLATDPTFTNFVNGYNALTVYGTSMVISGLSPGTYYYRVSANKSSVFGQGGYSAPITLNVLFAEPSEQASTISFTTLSQTNMAVSMSVYWISGNGNKRAVFMKEGSGAITNPTDGVGYAASADWNNKGTQLGSSGYYCIYDGTGSSVILTNLSIGSSYTLQVFEYNGSSFNIAIGQPFQGGVIAYVLQPGDAGYDAALPKGLITELSDNGAYGDWYAANDYCSNLTVDGYSDWYLPSLNDLSKIYANINAIGGLTNWNYWSSNLYEYSPEYYAYYLQMYNGQASIYYKWSGIGRRAVRSFSASSLSVSNNYNVTTASGNPANMGITGFDVTYNGNGATAGSVPDPGTYASGLSVTVSANTGNLSNTGFILGGWNTAADGSGTTYAEGSNFTITGNVTLHARWGISNTVSAASSSPSLCFNAPLANITHITTGATGISNDGLSGANGLPIGVSATWSSNTIVISGAPELPGVYNYSIPLTGGFGNVSATGTITIIASPIITASNNGPVCSGSTVNLLATPVQLGNYTYSTVAFAPVSGTPTPLVLYDDELSEAIDLPFPFTFYGNTYTSIYVSSNGFVSFDPDADPYNYGQALPDASNPNNLIALNWEDLNPSEGGSIGYFSTGDKFVIQFDGVYHYDSDATISGQIVLNANGTIDIHANNINSDYDDEGETMGIENADGTGALAIHNYDEWTDENVSYHIYSQEAQVLSYLWNGGNSPTTASNTASPSATTTYTVTATNGNGCASTPATTTVTINPSPEIPTISASGPTTFCAAGSSVTLSVANAPVITQTVPLDEVPGATLAVGLRKLKSSYTGAALRLRRSSDQAQQDFGFDGNNLDVNAISAWLDGVDGFCTTLYDQSGNGGHVTQPDDYKQPLFVANGINNKPILHFTTSQYMNNEVNYPPPYSVIYGSRVTGTSGRVLSALGNNWLLGYWAGLQDRVYFEGWVGESYESTVLNQYNIYAAKGTGTISTVYKNGVELYSNSNGLVGPNGIELNGSGGGGEISDCDITDVIIHGSALSAGDIVKLNNSIGMYYGAGTINPVSYLWSTLQTSSSISASTTGNYSVTVTNANGCSATSASTAVTAGSLTTPTLSVVQPTCSTLGSITVTNAIAGNTYSINGGIYSDTTVFAQLVAGNYSITAKNESGCISSPIEVIINAQPASPTTPTITASGPTTICSGSTVTLTIDNVPVMTQTVPLDVVPGATLAVSLRKLKSSYTGPALRLRRSSDQAQQDFGFDGNNLNVNAISAWLGGADGYCTTLYNQSGNGGNVIQPVDYHQPLFVFNGFNNKPTLRFTTSHYMNNEVNYPPPYSVVYGSKVIGTSMRVLAAKNNNWLLGYVSGKMDMAYFDGWVSTASNEPLSSTNPYTVLNQYNVYAATGTGAISTVYKNGVQLCSNNGGLSGPNGIQLNGTPIFTMDYSDCEFTDVLIYGSALAATDIGKLNTSIVDYYSSTYLWSTLQTSSSISVSTTGNYSVTVTNSNGCSATSAATAITAGSLTTPTASVVHPTCSALGSITVTNAIAGNTYSINGGSYSNTTVFAPLSGGIYVLRAKNESGCISSPVEVVINAQPAPPTTPATTVTQPTCTVASATITVSNVSAGNSYSIDGIDFSNTSGIFSGITAAGNKTVWAKNTSSGCTSSSTALINAQPPTPAAPSVSQTLSACNVVPTTAVVTVSNAISGNTYSIDGITFTNSNGIFNGVALGTYGVKVKNTSGCTSAATSVTISPAVPAAPTTVPASRCGTGSLVLGATAPANSKLLWYTAATGGASISVGSSYITAPLSINTTFYVQSVNNTSSCASTTRTAVLATINAIPTAPSALGVSRCGAGIVTLSATAPVGGTVAWYAAATGGTALYSGTPYNTASISANTTYYVASSITSTGCMSATRTAVLATVNALPALPTATGAARCGSGSVSLLATPPTGASLAWYTVSTAGTALATTNSYITPIIAANTTYYVESKVTTTGCVSATRTAVLATINALPTAPVAVGATRCSAGSVALTATAPLNGTVAWYAAAAGGTALSTAISFTTPSIAATTTYYVESKTTLTGCVSSARTAVIATVNPLPAAPSGIGVSRCGPGVALLTATPPAGTSIAWYSSATLGSPLSTSTSYTTPSLSANTTYYAESINTLTGCVSATRTALLVTVNPLPTAPVGVAASKCGAGSVILSATAPAGGTVTWYNAATAGTSLSTAASYTTPILSVNTTYYVEAKITASGCVSASRTALLATINPLPSAPAAIAGARCGAGTVILSATAPAGGTLAWYSVATAGTALSTATPYTTPSLTANTTYYVESKTTATGCVSATRTAVLAAVNALPAAPLGTAASRCGSGTVTLSATPASGCTVAWFPTATLGTTLSTTSSFTTPSITASTTYYAQSINSTTGCISATRTAVLATVNALPAAPLYTTGSRCGTGTVLLSAMAQAGTTMAWYATATLGTALATTASYTTPAISSTTIYYVESKNSLTGCVSLNRSAVTATINPLPASPTLSLTQPTVLVPSGKITVISALTGFSFSINSGVTYVSTGIFSGLAVGTYNVLAKNTTTNCVSLAAVAVINAVPTAKTSAIIPPAESHEAAMASAPPAFGLFEVSAFPNPSSTNFRLSINGASSETIRVTVYDVFGRTVSQLSFGPKPSITLCQDLKAGVYMIEVRQGKNMKTLKLVKF